MGLRAVPFSRANDRHLKAAPERFDETEGDCVTTAGTKAESRIRPPSTEVNELLAYRIQVLAGLINRRATLNFKRAFDLTIWESRTLAWLHSEPGLSLKELGGRLRLDKGQISRVVTSLTSRGLVQRSKAGKTISLTLSPAGLELHDRYMELAKLHDAEYTRALTGLEEAVFRRGLDSLLATVTELIEADTVE